VQDLSPLIAQEALALIGRLFAIEQHAKELSDAERLSLRQSQSWPIVTELHERLVQWKQSLLPKHPTTPISQLDDWLPDRWLQLQAHQHDQTAAV